MSFGINKGSRMKLLDETGDEVVMMVDPFSVDKVSNVH